MRPTIDFNRLSFGPQIGQGDFGKVFRGYYMNTVVAIKEIPLSQPFVQRFMSIFSGQEAAAQAPVLEVINWQMANTHPFISRFRGFARHGEMAYLVSDFQEGFSLRDWLSDPSRCRQLTLSLRLRILYEVATALAHLHALSPPIVHRDLKPDNVLLAGNALDPSSLHVRVADFGMASARSGVSHLSGAFEVYTSEEDRRVGELDARIDVFSLAVMGFELLASWDPLPRDRLLALQRAQLSADVLLPDVAAVSPDLARALFVLLGSGLAQSARFRPTADAVQTALYAAWVRSAVRDNFGVECWLQTTARTQGCSPVFSEVADFFCTQMERVRVMPEEYAVQFVCALYYILKGEVPSEERVRAKHASVALQPVAMEEFARLAVVFGPLRLDADVPSRVAGLLSRPGFMGHLSTADATARLQNRDAPIGTFLLRFSSSNADSLTLTFVSAVDAPGGQLAKGPVAHARIQMVPNAEPARFVFEKNSTRIEAAALDEFLRQFFAASRIWSPAPVDATSRFAETFRNTARMGGSALYV